MPYSYSAFYSNSAEYIRSNFSTDDLIIDIGVGSGTYKNIVPEYTLDGIEIYEKYINDFNLRERYRNIYNEDAINFKYTSEYKLATMGDVLEHMSVEDSKKLLKKLVKNKISILIQVPYMYEQGIYDGNEHEIHIQDDLTHELFLERYSEFGFTTLCRDHICGIYVLLNK